MLDYLDFSMLFYDTNNKSNISSFSQNTLLTYNYFGGRRKQKKCHTEIPICDITETYLNQ